MSADRSSVSSGADTSATKHRKGCEVPAQIRLFGHGRKCNCAALAQKRADFSECECYGFVSCPYSTCERRVIACKIAGGHTYESGERKCRDCGKPIEEMYGYAEMSESSSEGGSNG